MIYASNMTLTAKVRKRGQITLPHDVHIRYKLEEGQSVAFVVKYGELTLVPLRKTIFDFKGDVQSQTTSDLATIREQVAAAEADRQG